MCVQARRAGSAVSGATVRGGVTRALRRTTARHWPLQATAATAYGQGPTCRSTGHALPATTGQQLSGRALHGRAPLRSAAHRSHPPALRRSCTTHRLCGVQRNSARPYQCAVTALQGSFSGNTMPRVQAASCAAPRRGAPTAPQCCSPDTHTGSHPADCAASHHSSTSALCSPPLSARDDPSPSLELAIRLSPTPSLSQPAMASELRRRRPRGRTRGRWQQ